MPTILDELAAAAMIRRAMADGRDVRTLSDADYRKARSEMIASVERTRLQADDAAALARITAKYSQKKEV